MLFIYFFINIFLFCICINNNILLSKRVTQIQQAIMPFETKFVKQLVLNDMVIYNEIIAVLDNNEKAISKNFEGDEKIQTLINVHGEATDSHDYLFFVTLFYQVPLYFQYRILFCLNQ